MKRFASGLRPEALVAALAGTLLGAGLVGAHGGDAGLVHACDGGQGLRAVGSSEECFGAETAVHWRIQGDAGPAGPAGPAGDPGARGPAGSDGASGTPGPRYRFRVVRAVAPTSDPQNAVASCAPAERVISGGYANSNGLGLAVQWSQPGADGRSWDVRGRGGTYSGAWSLNVYAVCMEAVG